MVEEHLPFFTIGHSNRSLEDFASLLGGASVERVVDVRTVPRSRANPQFNEDSLPGALRSFRISYERIAELGGLRGKSRTCAPDVNGYWTNDSFHNYADYALTEGFRAGLSRLIDEGRERRCAIMCAEAVWWRCHRRIIADHLIARGESVFHIVGKGRSTEASLTPGAVVRKGVVVYPASNSTNV